MDICVIIPARNEAERIGSQLDALRAQEWDGSWEVVVVDNGSEDGTGAVVDAVSAEWPRLRLVVAAERADKSYAIATGLATSTADALAVCDADDVVAEGWLAALAAGLVDHEVVTGPNELDLLNPPWLAASRGRSDAEPVGSFYGIFPVIRGNNFAVRRDAWDRFGGFLVGFFPCEDIEFSLRCWLNDVDVVGLDDAVVHYRYRDAPADLWRQGFRYGANRPAIVRGLVDAGRPRPPRVAGWRSWMSLIVRLPGLLTAEGRAMWVWIAANRLGQVVGSWRHRVLML